VHICQSLVLQQNTEESTAGYSQAADEVEIVEEKGQCYKIQLED
jgi:hypothetical protein